MNEAEQIVLRDLVAEVHAKDARIKELREALEFVVNAYEASPSNERTMGFYEARNCARAAIAKATGDERALEGK